MFFAVIDSTDKVKFITSTGGPDEEYGNSITITNNDIYTTLVFSSKNININKNDINNTDTSGWTSDILLLKHDKNNYNILSYKKISGQKKETMPIICHNKNNLFLTFTTESMELFIDKTHIENTLKINSVILYIK